jgi:PKHD-type hydroxylase
MSTLVNNIYWKWDAVLSKEFCRSVLEQIDWAIAGQATVRGDQTDVVNTQTRRTDVAWQSSKQPIGCVSKCYMEMANQSAEWGYSLSEQEDTQIGRYKSVDEGYYDWHMDAGPPQNGIQRKLSCVILLNDPSEFEGGVLQFKGMEDQNLLDKQGSIIVFPSFVEHKVTPVTKGVRYSAVTWASGPSFR